MLRRTSLVCGLMTSLPMVCAAQSPVLWMPTAVNIGSGGGTFSTVLTASPGSAFAVFVDIDSGPSLVLGERLELGLSAALATYDSGVTPPLGVSQKNVFLPVFPGLLGLVIYSQGVTLDATAPNGVFRASNGSSTAYYAGSSSIIATFDSPVADGYTGTFDASVASNLRGGPVTTRTFDTAPASGSLFSQPVLSPLQPFGCREQVVYRAQDLGADGDPERIVAVRYRALGPVINDTFPFLDMRMGHTDVVPNYDVDPWSALPVDPESGLSTIFAANERPGAPPAVVYQGPFTIDPITVVNGNYVPMPMFAPFDYDGSSSLLLDFRLPPGISQGVNGIAHHLLVQSSPLPGTRVVRFGSAQQPVIPDQAVDGSRDNAMPWLQFEFQRLQTHAQSPWLGSLGNQPDYADPIVASVTPLGTSIELAFRGATDSTGSNATEWSSSPDVADGMPFLQFRVTFHANGLTGEVPQIDTLVVPAF